jgi:hypothetical protein
LSLAGALLSAPNVSTFSSSDKSDCPQGKTLICCTTPANSFWSAEIAGAVVAPTWTLPLVDMSTRCCCALPAVSSLPCNTRARATLFLMSGLELWPALSRRSETRLRGLAEYTTSTDPDPVASTHTYTLPSGELSGFVTGVPKPSFIFRLSSTLRNVRTTKFSSQSTGFHAHFFNVFIALLIASGIFPRPNTAAIQHFQVPD